MEAVYLKSKREDEGAPMGADLRDFILDGVSLADLSPEEVELHSAFHGQFLKYSLLRDGHEYLLKPPQPGYEALPAMEYTCNLIARDLGLRIPRFGRGWLKGELVFVSEQFITALVDKHGAANLNHLAKYFSEIEPSLWRCSTVVSFLKKEVSDPERALREFVELCLYDAIIGNGDRHQRNLAIVEYPGGAELSPLYDNTSYLALIPEEDALKQDSVIGCLLCEHTESPRLPDYVREFQRLGFSQWVRDFAARVQPACLLEKIESSPLSPARKQAFANYVSKRVRELKEGAV